MKTEKAKMLDGELYYAADPELVKERVNARRLTRLFNEVEREAYAKSLFVETKV